MDRIRRHNNHFSRFKIMNYHGQSPWYPQAPPSASSFRLAVSTGRTRGTRGTKIEFLTGFHTLINLLKSKQLFRRLK